MLNVQIRGDRELIAKLDAMPNRVKAELYTEVTKLAFKLEAKVKDEKLSGQVLHVVTGKLRRSIFNQIEQSSTAIMGKVASSGDVKYAVIHELGGKTPPHVIEAKGKALAFDWRGQKAFFKRVNHPGSTMPERSFMRSSLKDMRDEIVGGLEAAVKRGVAIR